MIHAHGRREMRLKEERCRAGDDPYREIQLETRTTQLETEWKVTTNHCRDMISEFERADTVTVIRRDSCPAHDSSWSDWDNEVRFSMLWLIRKIFSLFAAILHAVCPPWPPWIIRKIAFRAPYRGHFYYLIGGKKDNRKAIFNAGDAVGLEDLSICLPHMIHPKTKAIDIYYHILRCQPNTVEIDSGSHICVVNIPCEQTIKWLSRRASARPRSPNLIIFAQPNSSDIGCCLLMDPNFADIGDFLKCDLLVFDYAGYGISDGEASEKTIYESIEAVYKYAIEVLNYQAPDIILMGFSLGTAAMIHLAALHPNIGALILIAPFTSFWRVVARRPQTSAEASWRQDMFPSYDKAASIGCPTLVCHGEKDSIIGHGHGLALKDRIPNCKIFLLDQANHQGVFCERKMWDEMNIFLEERMHITRRWRDTRFALYADQHDGDAPSRESELDAHNIDARKSSETPLSTL